MPQPDGGGFCKYDTDGDGNCPFHPQGCPTKIPSTMLSTLHGNAVCMGCGCVMRNLPQVDGTTFVSTECRTPSCRFFGIVWNMPQVLLTRAAQDAIRKPFEERQQHGQ